jgi:multiple antibiotic resistance protein
MIKNYLLAFIPIFVAVDALGVLPLFISMTEGLSSRDRVRVIVRSMGTAMILAIAFIFLGEALFRFLGITVGDFMIAGGAILFCIGIITIIRPDGKDQPAAGDLGVVPLGTPLIVGPAVLTTSLMIVNEYGIVPTVVSVLLNILIAGAVFVLSGVIRRIIGNAGSKALSKVTSLFLAAIAVMMVRKGILLFVEASR